VSSYVLIADDGYGCHIESALAYTTLCGRTFGPEAVDREEYDPQTEPEEQHLYLCALCHRVGNGGSISQKQREIHFGRASA